MPSNLKKWFSRLIAGLFVLVVIVYTFRPILWTAGTGISGTLDKWLWGDTTNIQGNEDIVSKTVEKDKKGNIVKTIETKKYDYGKTVWDWLSLLGVPLALIFLGSWLQKEQQKRAENEVKEEVLQTYFDRLSILLIDKNLITLSNKLKSGEIKPEEQDLLDSSLSLIRARTLSILERFENDTERKTSVINFLIESDVISKLNLDLFKANLSNAELPYAQLSNAKLPYADLSNAFLYNANLYNAKLDHADLDHVILSNAHLCKAIFCFAKLSNADLSNADLCSANFSEANLSNADLLNIRWNSETLWPSDKSQFDTVKNIPEDLKKELNL